MLLLDYQLNEDQLQAAQDPVHWQGIFGAGAHSDYGMLTLLKTDEHPGLQIWSGGKFVDVPPRPGTFIVNLGDMLERCDIAVPHDNLTRRVQSAPVESYAAMSMLSRELPAFWQCCFMSITPVISTTSEVCGMQVDKWALQVHTAPGGGGWQRRPLLHPILL